MENENEISLQCVYWRLILKIVDDESGLHHGCVVVDYNKLNLCLVDNNLAVAERLL